MKKLSIKELSKKRKKKGFTLIELIIVIAIIAILATMAIPKFGAVRKSANIKTDVASAKNIQTAVASLIADGTVKPSGTEETEVEQSKYQGKLDGDKVPEPKATSGSFKATVDGDGNIKVYVGSDEVYPEQKGSVYGTDSSSSSAS
ncbi:prepilin-type N-terminal cleavage/methylation domain-containing protein [uncultured Clostridium sp.]|uniref:prepilin-type N-terminal cleavage/methylation domain-containing protein n=1 Tax=uncultured Clostridium sp. TaxID=59620 RepID=UPI0025F5BD5C|nr:prepilin-type N-terminal cleavage/methylation domain-containing protein [uncultured Clostridium sp.]